MAIARPAFSRYNLPIAIQPKSQGRSMEEKGSAEHRARYVWDRDKLTWVEALEKPALEEHPINESVAESIYVEGLEKSPAEDVLIEATAEAEGLQYRGAWIRLAGVIIDFIVLGVFNIIVSQATGLSGTLGQYLVPIFGVVYFIGFWTWRGQTPGKMIIGAKVLRIDGSPVGLGRAAMRYIGYFIYISVIQLSISYVHWALVIIICVGIFLATALNRDKRGLHDRIAGTVVINTRPKPLEDYEEEEEYGEDEEYEEAYEAEEEVEASEESWNTAQG